MIKYIILISSIVAALGTPDCSEITRGIYNGCMKKHRDRDMCTEYREDAENYCDTCLGDIEKCMSDRPRENCNDMSIRVLKKCMKSGKPERKCNALSSKIFFDCYQY